MNNIKPVKLNPLQAKTLALLQQLAKHPESSEAITDSSDIRITRLPHAHGDHMHVGGFVVAARDASGLNNPSVWAALARKGMILNGWETDIVITETGLNHATGLEDRFMHQSDH